MHPSDVISVLARCFLVEGTSSLDEVHARAVRTLGRKWHWLQPLTRRYLAAFSEAKPRHRDVVRFLLEDPDFAQARLRYGRKITIADWPLEPQRMQPGMPFRKWHLPVIDAPGDLADWLSLSVGELEWFADLKQLGSKLRNSKLQHYRYSILPKRPGGLRLIESPKRILRDVQRRIHSGILDRVPVHPAVHGFVKGRSTASFASPHTGKAALLRIDLQDFFPGFPGARLQAFFRTLGYAEPVANCLGGICSNLVPREVFNRMPFEIDSQHWSEIRELYNRPHLPQGAPTSPALANLMAYRLDCRLTGLAKATDAVYTRYADDLAFSGDEQFLRGARRFAERASAIALEEGCSVNFRKTRLMTQGVRQQLAGLVINHKLNLCRRDLERLEAVLTNCIRFGPASQNLQNMPDWRAHLQGRIAYVHMIHPQKADRLEMLFQAIKWDKRESLD